MSAILGNIYVKWSEDLIRHFMNSEKNHNVIKVYEQIVGTDCIAVTHWIITHFFNFKKSVSLTPLSKAFNYATDLVILYAKLS